MPEPDFYGDSIHLGNKQDNNSKEPGSSTNLIPLVAGAWRTSMWWGRAMVSRGPDPSHSQLKVMVAWSPDELALTYNTHCGLRFLPRTSMNMGMIMEHCEVCLKQEKINAQWGLSKLSTNTVILPAFRLIWIRVPTSQQEKIYQHEHAIHRCLSMVLFRAPFWRCKAKTTSFLELLIWLTERLKESSKRFEIISAILEKMLILCSRPSIFMGLSL